MEVNSYVDRFADIGCEKENPENGRDCVAYTENEDRVHEIFRSEAEKLLNLAEKNGCNLKVEEDPFGNSYVTLEGKNERKLIICSHLDSVYNGGRYDGIVGVSAGLSALRQLIENNGKPDKTIQVIAFRAEESSATGKACLGSSLATGQYTLEDLKKINHKKFKGKNIADVLMKRGLTKDDIEYYSDNPYIDIDNIEAAIELHVEQSGVLEYFGHPVGIVSRAIGGSVREDIHLGDSVDDLDLPESFNVFEITVYGEPAHTGGTPMNGETVYENVVNLRKDALSAAANFLISQSKGKLIDINVPEAAYNVIPAKCVLTVAFPPDVSPDDIKNVFESYLSEGMEAEIEMTDVDEVQKNIRHIREKVAISAMEIIKQCEDVATELAKETEGLVRATVSGIRRGEQDECCLFLMLDQRRLCNEKGKLLDARLSNYREQMESDRKIKISAKNRKESFAVPINSEIQKRLKKIYSKLFPGRRPVKIGSMPGHDISKIISAAKDKYIPGGMIYIRGRDNGISHNPAEYSSPEDIEQGARFLMAFIEDYCYSAFSE